MRDLIGRHARTARSFATLGAVVAALVIFATAPARAQSPVLPMPAADRQEIATQLGAGVLGAALPSDPIHDASAFFPLHERTLVFQVTSGSNAGNTQSLSLKRANRPGGAPAWRFKIAPDLAAFVTLTADGDLMMPTVSDLDEGVFVVTTPANPLMLKGIRPGESRSFSQTVSVNYLDNPTKQDYSGNLNAVYTYVGTHAVTVPAGAFNTAVMRLAYQGKVGPASVSYTAWYFFAPGVGVVAMINHENVSAFWIYHVHTTTGKVLSVK